VDSVEQPKIKTSSEPAGTRVVRLTVEVPEERVQQQMHRTAREIAQRANIPGFRKGKAPYAIILQRFGEAVIRQKAADDLTDAVYQEALEQESIIPFSTASLEDIQLDPLRFTFTVPLPPLVELGDYRAVRLPPPAVEASPDEVATVLAELQAENAILQPAEGRPARAGDMLRLSVEGRGSDGQLFLQDEDAEVVLDPQDGYPAPGFYQAIEGMEIGQQRSFRLKMPAGRPVDEAEFTVTLLALFDRTLPNIDDDLARTVGNFDSLEALKQDIEEKIRAQRRQEADEDYRWQVVDAVAQQARIEYPPDLVERNLDRLQERFAQQVERERRMNLTDFLKLVGKSVEEWRDSMRPRAEEQLRRTLMLRQVIIEEKMDVSDEEVEQRIATLSAPWGDQAGKVRARLGKAASRESLRDDILFEKAITHLVTIARGEADRSEPKEE